MRLLIAYDGSQYSASAVTDLQLAGLPTGTEAVVVSVLDDRSSGVGAATGGTELRGTPLANAGEDGERQLAVAQQGANLVRTLFPSWVVTAEVCVGSPAWEIIKRAEGDAGEAGTRAFDLVVVGSRGLGEFKRLLLGSVAHRVVTTLRGSVRVSRERVDRMNPQSEAGVTPPRLLLGLDGSPDAQAALEAVASRSWPIGTRIVVATFVTGPRAMALLSEPNTVWGGTPFLPDSPAAEASPGLRVVYEAAELLRRRHPGLCVTTLMRPADPKYGLLGAAESWDKDGADCIFVGATGIRGIERFLVGSVSTTVAMNATCSVEIVRRST